MNLADNIQFKHSVLNSNEILEIKGLIDGGKSLSNKEIIDLIEKRAALIIKQEYPVFADGLEYVVDSSNYRKNLVNPFLLWAFIAKNNPIMFILDEVINPKGSHPLFYLNNNYNSLFKVEYEGNGSMCIQSNLLGIGMEGPYTLVKSLDSEGGHQKASLKDGNDFIHWTFQGFPISEVSKTLISYWIRNRESLKPLDNIKFVSWSWVFFTIYCYFRFHNYPMSFNTMGVISGAFNTSDSLTINIAENHIEYARKAFKFFSNTKRINEPLRDVNSFYQLFNINNGEGLSKYYKTVKSIQEIQDNPKYNMLKRDWIDGYGKGTASIDLVEDYYETFTKLYWKSFTDDEEGEI